MSSGKWRPSCLGLNVLNMWVVILWHSSFRLIVWWICGGFGLRRVCHGWGLVITRRLVITRSCWLAGAGWHQAITEGAAHYRGHRFWSRRTLERRWGWVWPVGRTLAREQMMHATIGCGSPPPPLILKPNLDVFLGKSQSASQHCTFVGAGGEEWVITIFLVECLELSGTELGFGFTHPVIAPGSWNTMQTEYIDGLVQCCYNGHFPQNTDNRQPTAHPSYFNVKKWRILGMFLYYTPTFNSLRPSDAYMHRPSLVQIMACRLFGAKQLFEPMLTFVSFGRNFEVKS